MGMMERIVQRHRGRGAGGTSFLTFKLGGEEYGIDILKVQEIRGYEAVDADCQLRRRSSRGLVNLRGVIVPIVDLRVEVRAVGEARYDAFTVVIILNRGGARGRGGG